MKNIQDYLTNKDAPSAGFSQGKLKDDPGDGSGSGIVVATHNDFLYCHLAPIIKYIGDTSDTAESETASDALEAMEKMAGVANENVSEYSGATTYAQFDHVMYLGMMFVSLIGSNTGNDPIDTPAKWMPCYNRDDAMVKYRNGEIIPGGIEEMHDIGDALYLQYYEFGKYNYGGNSGRNFQAYGVHLDGTQITGDATLVAIFDVGGANEYPHLDIIAPDIVGVRTLMDAQGRVGRATDGGTLTAAVGAVQADQVQGHMHYTGAGSSQTTYGIYGSTTNDIPGSATDRWTGTSSAPVYQYETSVPKDDGTNGTPRTGTETRMLNYTTGVPSILVMLELP
jgi:hypothetical protein